jgi:hypothetical protein
MRQYKIFVLAIQVILSVQHIYCGFERTVQPAAVTGRGYSGTAQLQQENVGTNPAAVSTYDAFRMSLFYTPSPYQLPQLASFGVMSGMALGPARMAVGYQTFGFALYRETAGMLSIGGELGDGIHAGVTLQLAHLSVERYGSAVTALIDAGCLYSLTGTTSFGLAVQNLTGAGFGADDDIPRTLLMGLSQTVEGIAVLNADIVHDSRYPVAYRAGADLPLHEFVVIRAGVDGGTERLFGGFSLSVLPFRIDYAVTAHPVLGLSHTIGITVQ